ncbi:hypothetical protein HYX14_02000 [Candidatus Woesearchaeota archaeon]|nr:hypothetical protein [Candidatus Woesearchaeota archaeon]
MAEESIFLEHVGDNPRMRILQYLIEGKDFDYTLTDLLNAGVSWGTLNTLVPKLLELGMIVKTRKIGRATLYKINQDNVAVKQLIELYDNLLLEKLSQMETQTEKVVASHQAFTQESIPTQVADS